jgi:hypothetical protein
LSGFPKNGLPETIIQRPFSEFHLADDHRFDPPVPLHFGGSQTLVPTAPTSCREVKKRTVFDPDLVQLSVEIVQEFLGILRNRGEFKLPTTIRLHLVKHEILAYA